jgi:hypothetical protein
MAYSDFSLPDIEQRLGFMSPDTRFEQKIRTPGLRIPQHE